MRPILAFALLSALLIPGIAQAKRLEAAKVEPVIVEGIKYTAPNDNGLRGYIHAVDAASDKTLYDIVLYRIDIVPTLEEDVQWIFIKSMKVQDGKLIVTDEKGRMYSVDLKTQAVTPLHTKD